MRSERSYQFWHSRYILCSGAGLLAIWRSPDGTNDNGNRLKGKLPKIESGPENGSTVSFAIKP